MLVDEPMLMGGKFGDEDQRVITRYLITFDSNLYWLFLKLVKMFLTSTSTLSGEGFVGEKWRNFSPTNKVIKELLSSTKDIEVVVIDDE